MKELTPGDIHDMEQGQGVVRDHFVPMIYSFYKACTEEGFKDEQALVLTNSYMLNILNLSPPKEL